MSLTDDRGPGGSALDSVRQIERTLEDRQETERAAEARLRAARGERERILEAAREAGEKAAGERRREVLAGTDERAGRILESARAEAEELRARAAAVRTSAVRSAVEFVLTRGRD